MPTDKPAQEAVTPQDGADKWKLDTGQRRVLLKWIAEGCTPREISKRAADFKRPFKISRQGVDYYRQKTKTKVREIREQAETDGILAAFAEKAERVKALDDLARRLIADLDDKGLWLKEPKSIGYGEDAEIVTIERFNSAEISEIRAALADIASEMGDRRGKSLELPIDGDAGIKIYVGVDPDKV